MKAIYKNEAVAKATTAMIASWKQDDENAVQAAAEKWSEAIFEQMANEYEAMANDKSALAARGYRQLTTEENDFWAKFAKKMEAPQAAGFQDILPGLPVTIINDIAKNLTEEHPLLNAVRFQNVGYATKLVLNGHTAQNAAWGAIPSAVSQQITSNFKVLDLTLAKLSCYAVLPLDLVRMGASFLDNYVRTIITEAAAGALEAAIVTGDGNGKPIGMDRKVDAQAVVTSGVYAKKTAVDVTDFTPESYGALIADNLLTTDGGVHRSDLRSLCIVCNPVDYLKKVMPATTVLNNAGQYVNGLFPVPTAVYTSAALTAGDAVIGFADEYYVGLGAPKTGSIEVSDEFKFLDDARTFKTITYANGRAFDNSSFALLDISALEPAYLNVKTITEA